MKMLKTSLVLTLCLFALPTLAKDTTNKELRKEKRRFTKKVRAVKAAQKEKSIPFKGKWSKS